MTSASEPTSSPISVTLVDDDISFRKLFSIAIEHHPKFNLLGSYACYDEALEQLPNKLPQVLIADLHLYGRSGLELTKVVRRRWPDIRIAMLSGHCEKEYAEQALSAGAHGYILKSSPQQILAGVEMVAAGKSYVSDEIGYRL